jgi:hypothetical protein
MSLSLDHSVDIPVLKLGTFHTVHVVFHRKLLFHRARRTVAPADLVYAAETIAHETEYAFLVILSTFRVGRTRPASAQAGKPLHLDLFILRACILQHFHRLVECIHKSTESLNLGY